MHIGLNRIGWLPQLILRPAGLGLLLILCSYGVTIANDPMSAAPSLLQHRSISPDGTPVEFRGALLFAHSGWAWIRVQVDDRSFHLLVSREQAAELSSYRPGCLIDFRGVVERDREKRQTSVLRVNGFNVVDADHQLPSQPAKLDNLKTAAQSLAWGTLEGSVSEVLIRRGRTYLMVQSAEHRVGVAIFSDSQGETPRWQIGQHIRITGYLRKRPRVTLRTISAEFLLMRSDQIQPCDDPLPQLAKGFATSTKRDSGHRIESSVQINGTVAYSNQVDSIAVIEQHRRYWVRTSLADFLKAGMKVVLSGSMQRNNGQDLMLVKSHVIKTAGTVPLPSGVAMTIESSRSASQLPGQITLRGTIVSSGFWESTYQIRLEDSGKRCTALVSLTDVDGQLPFDPMSGGTMIEISGMPIRSEARFSSGASESDNELIVLVGSLDQLRMIARPVTVNSRAAVLVLSFIAIGLAAGLMWIIRLRRKVVDRESRLTMIDSHLQSAFSAINGAMLFVDANSKIVRVSHQFETLFGIAPRLNSNMCDYLAKLESTANSVKHFEELRQACNQTCFRVVTGELTSHDGERTIQVFTLPIKVDGEDLCGRLWMFGDVSERQKLEAELVQSQKMEAVGRLSGGIAHDFNNYLSVIRSSLNTITSPTQQDQECIQAANVAVGHAADLTQQLLGFARRNRLERKRLDVNQMVDEVVPLVKRLTTSDQQLIVNCAAENGIVLVDKNRLQQAILNICLNALDAIKLVGGEVRLFVASIDDVSLGPSVQIRIEDNGHGMTPEIQQRIFEPFYTTKGVGEGTGLGLSVAQGIVEQHGGRLDCRSETGIGTTFEIVLPIASYGTDRIVDQSAQSPESAVSKLKILLVDDDELVCKSTAALLRNLSHEVVAVHNGMQALKELSVNQYDLVILDLHMPEMSGIETYHEIRSAWSNLPVIFCSGYSPSEWELDEYLFDVPPPVLEKPFSVEQLEATIQQAISHSSQKTPATNSTSANESTLSTLGERSLVRYDRQR